jgi:hypothetical protein
MSANPNVHVDAETVIKRCRWCKTKIVQNRSGVWLALPYADVSGFCPASTDDERHKPQPQESGGCSV